MGFRYRGMEMIPELLKYSKNIGNRELKQLHKEIERLHANFLQLHFFTTYIKDEEFKKVEEATLRNYCKKLKRKQATLLKYHKYATKAIRQALIVFEKKHGEHHRLLIMKGIMCETEG